jgi:hypothetical protein
MMKESGIIMSGDHPKLIIDDVKTMTRRTYGLEAVNQLPDDWKFLQMEGDLAVFQLLRKHWSEPVNPRSTAVEFRGEEPHLEFLYRCPYGQVGDRLWVREAWATEKRYNHLKPSEIPDTAKIYYVDKVIHSAGGYSLFTELGKVRSAMFMCEWMARITLEITGVRVERLQEISIEDIKKEGAYFDSEFAGANAIMNAFTPKLNFIWLWDSLNAKRGYGWETNPWVWVIEFRRLTDASH